MKQLLFLILLILTFLIAAKSHGRQYRLERELEGHWTVSFTSENHPWVERFWFRHRVLYWSIASWTAIALIALRIRFLFNRSRKSQWILIGLFTIGSSMIVAFVCTGLLSWARLALKLSLSHPAPSSQWLENLHLISLGWWLLTLALVLLLLKIFRSSTE
ncbi:hypothetical protein L0222_21870 [bacterium]|nr:hypothetical protein [bacterium]